jgi:hypothetical protein
MTTVSSVPADTVGSWSSWTSGNFSQRLQTIANDAHDLLIGRFHAHVSRKLCSAVNHSSDGSAFIHDCDVANQKQNV